MDVIFWGESFGCWIFSLILPINFRRRDCHFTWSSEPKLFVNVLFDVVVTYPIKCSCDSMNQPLLFFTLISFYGSWWNIFYLDICLLPWCDIFYLDIFLLPWHNIFYLDIILLPWCDISTLIIFYCRDQTFSTLISFYCRDVIFLPWYHFTTVMRHFLPWYHFTAVNKHFLP